MWRKRERERERVKEKFRRNGYETQKIDFIISECNIFRIYLFF